MPEPDSGYVLRIEAQPTTSVLPSIPRHVGLLLRHGSEPSNSPLTVDEVLRRYHYNVRNPGCITIHIGDPSNPASLVVDSVHQLWVSGEYVLTDDRLQPILRCGLFPTNRRHSEIVLCTGTSNSALCTIPAHGTMELWDAHKVVLVIHPDGLFGQDRTKALTPQEAGEIFRHWVLGMLSSFPAEPIVPDPFGLLPPKWLHVGATIVPRTVRGHAIASSVCQDKLAYFLVMGIEEDRVLHLHACTKEGYVIGALSVWCETGGDFDDWKPFFGEGLPNKTVWEHITAES